MTYIPTLNYFFPVFVTISCITLLQVAIAWQYHSGIPLLAKSVTASRIAENLAAKDIHLDESDMQAIDGLDRNTRLLYGRWGYKPNQTPHEFWDGENIISPV